MGEDVTFQDLIDQEKEHVMDSLTELPAQSEEYAKAVDNYSRLVDIELAVAADEREEREYRSKRRFRVGRLVVGGLTTLGAALGTVALESWLTNRDVLPNPFMKRALDDNRSSAQKWADRQMSDD